MGGAGRGRQSTAGAGASAPAPTPRRTARAQESGHGGRARAGRWGRAARPGGRRQAPRSDVSITYWKTSGATIVASDSTTNRGVSGPSLPQVIFSFGTAPEYDP